MLNQIARFLLIAMLNLSAAGAVTAQSENPRGEICAPYSGKAFGICTSAVNKECGTANETNENSCANMEQSFANATGEFPPWLTQCPCWTKEEIENLRHPSDTFSGEVNSCENGGESGLAFAWTVYRLKRHATDTYNYWAMVKAEQTATKPGLPNVIFCEFEDTCGADAQGGCSNVERRFSISDDELVHCAAEIIDSGFERSLDCFTD